MKGSTITALILLVPSVGFMLFIERFLKADVLAKVGSCPLVGPAPQNH